MELLKYKIIALAYLIKTEVWALEPSEDKPFVAEEYRQAVAEYLAGEKPSI